jgi:cyclophilin family peptidyl-prolyl cis-trans isomerase
MIKKTLLTPLAAIFMSMTCAVMAQETKPEPKPEEPKTEATTQPVKGIVKAIIETSKGNIELELDAEKAPLSVQNFVNYVNKGHYDGTIFHRVIPGFMIQGGGFTPDMQQKPTDKPIQCESKNGLKNTKGAIAMARTNDPHSATTQFFINVKDNASLDYPSFDGWGYAVFGKVTKGIEVTDAIVSVPTTRKGPHSDVPAEPITITKVSIVE